MPTPRDEALIGSVISVTFLAFFVKSRVGPRTGINSAALNQTCGCYEINNPSHCSPTLAKNKAINQPRIVIILTSLFPIDSRLLNSKPSIKAVMQPIKLIIFPPY